MKVCRQCGLLKIFLDYVHDTRYKDDHANFCRKCEILNSARRTQAVRSGVFDKLGRQCVRCGFDDIRALQFDHISGGGRSDRANKSPLVYYRSILERLDEFQILCANCNVIKRIVNGEN